MEIIGVLLFLIGGGLVLDVTQNDAEVTTQVKEFLDKEIGDDLLGIEDPNQKYVWGNQTVDKYGNLKEE